ncbi:MAG TPA: hypothetical protein VGL91_04435 [Acidobacteriota bacterium]|jgi:hypothetical protein
MKFLKCLFLIALLLLVPNFILGQDPQAAGSGSGQTTTASGQNGSAQPDPLTPGGKFKYALHDSILSPMSYVKSVASAGYSEAVDSGGDRGFGWGPEGFAKRFGDRMGGTIVHDFSGYWITASLFHQDPRYFPSPDRRVVHRILYAASRVFVTRSDNGDSQFNISNFVGMAASNAAQIGWTPNQDFTAQRFSRRMAKSIGMNMGAKIVKEFLTRKKNP